MKHSVKLILAICLLPTAALAQQPQMPPAPVAIEEAKRDMFSSSLWVSGTIISKNDARIAAETDGRITWVADVGTFIEQGQAMARIDAADLELSLADSEAQLASLKSQIKFQESSLSRLQTLAQSSNASATQIDEAQSQLDMTRQSINRANVAIKQIKRRISQTQVLAPFGGVVAERLVQVGEFVGRGAQVARLVDTHNREIRVQAPLSVAGWVSPEMQVTVEHQNIESFSPINSVIPVGDERSRMFELRVAADNPGWIVGSPVRVSLPSSEPRDLVAIPRDGLVMRGSSVFVMRVNADNTVERINVETGIGLGGYIEVIGGINQGDRIVTRGGERLQPGQSVTIAEEPVSIAGSRVSN